MALVAPKVHIHQHQVYCRRAAYDFDGLLRFFCQRHVIAVALKNELQREANGLIIVNYQYHIKSKMMPFCVLLLCAKLQINLQTTNHLCINKTVVCNKRTGGGFTATSSQPRSNVNENFYIIILTILIYRLVATCYGGA